MFLKWIILFSTVFPFAIGHNFYSTIDKWTGTKYDCIYVYISSNFFRDVIFGSPHLGIYHQLKDQIIPFCLTLEHFNVREESCTRNNGILWTFEYLKKHNVTSDDLANWNATIDTIDEYQYYLETENNQSETIYFCNCTDKFHFGRECQYSFGMMNELFIDILASHFLSLHSIKEIEQGTMNDADTTCYKRDVSCYGGCLDWRQICNGIVDCSNGQDEISCDLLELNECRDDEYRCQSGHCIPIVFAFDKTLDCADGSDEEPGFITVLKPDTCYHKVPNMFCDDYNNAWMMFPCGDGESNPILFYSCSNGRHARTVEQLYVDNATLCWQYLICKHYLNYLFRELVNCTALCGENRYCPFLLSSVCDENIVLFPPRPILFSPSVYLAYETNKTDHVGPDFICYTQCDHLYPPSLEHHGYSCRLISEFLDEPLHPFSPVGSMFYDLLHIFNGCIDNKKTSNNSLLFRCPIGQKIISYHRIKDGFKDCYLGLDESWNESICIQNSTQQFQCWASPSECISRRFLEDDAYHCSDRSDEFHSLKCRYGTESVCDYQRGLHQPMLIQYQFMVI